MAKQVQCVVGENLLLVGSIEREETLSKCSLTFPGYVHQNFWAKFRGAKDIPYKPITAGKV